MRDVAVLGVGMTTFGKFPETSIRELGAQAVREALRDADVRPGEVGVAYCGNLAGGLLSGQESALGQIILREVGIRGIPIMKVENACSSGSSAFREAWIAVGSGLYDLALAVGVEQLSVGTTSEVMQAFSGCGDVEMEAGMGMLFPGIYALMAQRRAKCFGTTLDHYAQVSVKNHANGVLNPRAQHRKTVSIEDVLASPMVCDPLRVLDCCPIGDGAAAAILCSAGIALRFTAKPIVVAASVLVSGMYEHDSEYVSFESTRRAAAAAYEMAGIGPNDVSLAEVHDCFSVAELCHYEDLGFCSPGDGGRLIEEGETQIGGRIPVNPSGGLLAKGHPVGATGVAQIAEVVWQLRGEAGERQVANATVGLTHCMGGYIQGDAVATSIQILCR